MAGEKLLIFLYTFNVAYGNFKIEEFLQVDCLRIRDNIPAELFCTSQNLSNIFSRKKKQ